MKNVLATSMGFGLNVLSLIAPSTAGKLGFQLFCYPFRAKLSHRHSEFLNSAERFEILHEEERVQVYKWGAGARRVLFLHGWQSHTYRWKSYIDALNKSDYTVYALDAPGHGLSTGKFLTVPLYGQVIKKLLSQVGSVDTLVSHSLGGFTSIYLVHHEPSLAPKKMVVMAPPGEAKEFFDFYKSSLRLSERTINLTKKHFEKVVGNAPEYYSAAAFASRLNVPGLLIHDEDDDETSVENSRNIHHAWTNSRLIITKGIGHNLKSQELIDEVVNYIGQTQAHEQTTLTTSR